MPNFLRLTGLALIIALAACGGCASSNTALKAHTTAAQTLDDVADQAKELALADREQALTQAATQAKVNGADVTKAVTDAAAAYDAGPTIPAVNAFVAAKDAYVRAVLMDAGKDEPTWTNARRLLKDVVDAYTNLRAALGNPEKMPKLPVAIASLLTMARPDGRAGVWA